MDDEPIRFNRDSKFDLQLSAALVAERRLAEIFRTATFERVELKTETYQWRRTGNVVIEYESRGRPSGIAVSQADHWVLDLRADDGSPMGFFVLPREVLREHCRQAWLEGRYFTNGGDDKAQSGILLRVHDLLKLAG